MFARHVNALEAATAHLRRESSRRRAETGVQAVEQACDEASGIAPDLIVLDDSLRDIDPLDASRALRDDPRVGSGVPILLVTAGKPTTAEHHAALRAGIWEYVAHPFHAEEVGEKLDGYLRWKLEAARARHGDDLADATGLYTLRGLALRAQELTLQAFHHAASLACVALAGVDGELLAGVLRAGGRRSDAIGRVGPGQFAVVAPGTHRTGGARGARRARAARRLRRGHQRALHADRAEEPAGARDQRPARRQDGRRWSGLDQGVPVAWKNSLHPG